MSDQIKYEFIQSLDEYEELTHIFDSLQAETVKLKEQYRLDPNNQELLDYIKAQEEKYKLLLEKFNALNIKSKELLDRSKAENNDNED